MDSALRLAFRALETLLILAATLALVAAGAWLYGERQWEPKAQEDEEAAFRHGTLGLEIMPLKLAAVLGKTISISDPDGKPVTVDFGAGLRRRAKTSEWDWRAEYGFITEDAKGSACTAQRLPVGFTISNLIPGKAATSPVQFVGLACAVCHSSRLRTGAGKYGPVVIGAGSGAADVIAFGDAFKQAVSNPEITARRILDAYDRECGADSSPWHSYAGRHIEWFIVRMWLNEFRATIETDNQKYDMPYAGADLLRHDKMPAGPSRTRPFRSVVRQTLNLSGAENYAFSKIPAAFQQDEKVRRWSQYDGSIRNAVVRSLIAAFTSGSTPDSLAHPAVKANIDAAAKYTLALAPGRKPIPTMAEHFGAAPDPDAKVQRGAAAYRQHCQHCHGQPGRPGELWNVDRSVARWAGLLAPRKAGAKEREAALEVRTDGARLDFRYAPILPLALETQFPFPPKERAQQAGRLAAAAKDAKDDLAQAQFWLQRAKDLDKLRRRFPLGHPYWRELKRAEIKPPAKSEVDERRLECPDADEGQPFRYNCGYINNPIPGVYLRAPFLHNGSVPTLRQLLNLDERPVRFCRGDNEYDRDAVGLKAPAPVDGTCPAAIPFLFDTGLPGNSSRGHDKPYSREEVEQDPAKREELEALIAYLKTL